MHSLLIALGVVDALLFALWYFCIDRDHSDSSGEGEILAAATFFMGGGLLVAVNVIAIGVFWLVRHFR